MWIMGLSEMHFSWVKTIVMSCHVMSKTCFKDVVQLFFRLTFVETMYGEHIADQTSLSKHARSANLLGKLFLSCSA